MYQEISAVFWPDTFKRPPRIFAPVEVKVDELIEGYRERIQLMNRGARYKFFIPWELAWGKKGTGSKIPPYAMLIFDVRLIDF